MFLVAHLIREKYNTVQLNCMGMFHFYIVLYRCVYCLLLIGKGKAIPVTGHEGP
jgi:hypothetical protein